MNDQNQLFQEDAEPYRPRQIGPSPVRLAGSPDDAALTRMQKEQIIAHLLSVVIGEDSAREGLVETPKRVVKAWSEWTAGYAMVPADILKSFEDGAEGANDLVIVRNIPFYSHCEHHLAPFFGSVTIGYVPDGKVVGLSKLGRLSDCFAKRLQVQERYTNQIADALMENLKCRFVGVVADGRHMCMESRGIKQCGQDTRTQAFRYDERETDFVSQYRDWRAEFMSALR